MNYRKLLIIGLALSSIFLTLVITIANPQYRINRILTQVLNSHKNWNQVEGSAEFTWYQDGDIWEQYETYFSVDQYSYAHILQTSKLGGGIPIEVVIDDEIRYGILNRTRVYFIAEHNKEDMLERINSLPSDLELVNEIWMDWSPEMAHIHSFGSKFLSPVENNLFPQWLAAYTLDYLDASFSLKGSSTLLGRNVWVVRMLDEYRDFIIWIDKETGLILKMEEKHHDYFFTMEILEIKFDTVIDRIDLSFLNTYEEIEFPPAPHICYYGPWCTLE